MMPLSTATRPRTSLLDDILARICHALQLTPTQQVLAEKHYNSVSDWLAAEDSPLAAYLPRIFPQGSLRIGTTVRPKGRTEYDLDLVGQVEMGWRDPVTVLNEVEARLRAHGTYRPMVERKNRCVRLNFAGDFHMDILPARRDPSLPGTCLLVPDRELRDWKPSNPKGYATWFESRSALRVSLAEKAIEPLPDHETADEKSPLQLSVQLLKRWRDVRYATAGAVAPISIVLTTLAAHHYRGEDAPLEALAQVVSRIVGSLPDRGRLYVCNPANPLEDLSERWDRDLAGYAAFVAGIQELERDLVALSRLRGVADAAELLQRLFGELVPRVITEQAYAIEKARRDARLGVGPGSTGALTTTLGAGAIAVPKNTFYGD